jgi:hypothetical protein
MSFCMSAKEMIQTCGPPDLCFVFPKADKLDDNIYVKGLIVFSFHINETKTLGNSTSFSSSSSSMTALMGRCHSDCPCYAKFVQTTNFAVCILTIMSYIQKCTELRCLLLQEKKNQSRSLSKYFLFHLSIL